MPAAWTEYGEFDKLGHDLQAKLAARIEDQLELLLERVQGLLDAGWKRVRVVTDHGWLLVPGGMPKVQLPKYLAESRWSRCASIKDSSHVEVPVAGWSWNPQERFAYAPGVHCFVAGQEYAHGGASLQECLVPVLTFVSTSAPAGVVVTVSEVQWVGLRCRVTRGAGGRRTAGGPADEAQRRRLKHYRAQAVWTPTARPRCWSLTTPSKGRWSAWSLSMRPGAWSAKKPPPLEVTSNMELDHLDQLAASAFDGYLVRKDLCGGTAGSIRCPPTSWSSCSGGTARRSTNRRSRKA